jgi:ABC-type bacteriocin/lantibiotic exporter with double-glycine peptidase domain
MTSNDCGSACLAMLLAYHGRKRSAAACRVSIVSGTEGATAFAIAQAARAEGLQVQALAVEPKKLRDLPLPAIAHWHLNHFVVLERVDDDAFVIIDPKRGRLRISSEELEVGFSGVLLTFKLQANVESLPSVATSRIGLLRSRHQSCREG